MRIKNHINGVALSLALKQRLESTRKWPIHLSLVNSALLVLPQKSRTDYRINRDFVFQLNFLCTGNKLNEVTTTASPK